MHIRFCYLCTTGYVDGEVPWEEFFLTEYCAQKCIRIILLTPENIYLPKVFGLCLRIRLSL